MDNECPSKHFRNRDGDLDIPGRNSSYWFPFGLSSKRRKKVIGSSSGIGGYDSRNAKGSRCSVSSNRKTGANKIMGVIFKTTREWWLVGVCMILLLMQFFPQVVEFVYPIIDWKGGNRLSMQVDKEMGLGQAYHCGEVVRARFILQKQRMKVGEIQWKLIASTPEGQSQTYPARKASSPIGIIDHWAAVEKIPSTCEQGQYHFEGTITYPLVFDKVIYTIRTVCFIVR